MAKQLNCQLITPEAALFSGSASAVAMTAHDGEVGVLRDRAPMLCRLGIGECRITADGGVQHYYIEGGFAQVIDNQVTILTQRAQASHDIDVSAAQQALQEARARKASGVDEVDQRRADITRAATQIRVASKS